jgi:hypothetical protein
MLEFRSNPTYTYSIDLHDVDKLEAEVCGKFDACVGLGLRV